MRWLCWFGLHDWAVLRSFGGGYYGPRLDDRICLRCAKRDNQIERADERKRRHELLQQKRTMRAKELLASTIDNNFR